MRSFPSKNIHKTFLIFGFRYSLNVAYSVNGPLLPYPKFNADLFDKLLKKREHISLVIDEYGSVRGIVTLEDIIETLLGLEIVDETDTVVDLQALAKKRGKKYLK